MEPCLEDLQQAIEANRTAQETLRRAKSQLQETLTSHIGKVLPLKGIANILAASSSQQTGSVVEIHRGGSPNIFGPGYFRVNNVTPETVLLGSPESNNPRVGFVAVLSTIQIAGEGEIEEANRSRAEAVAQQR